MGINEKVMGVQGRLQKLNIDGWLLYDFQGNNSLARQFLEIPPAKHLTRRFFYWIPSRGEPVQVVHEIEPQALEHLPGEKRVYLRWQTLEAILQELLKSSCIVAMEYSRRCAVPYVSKIDAGTVELVKECGVEVVSSDAILQYYNCVLSEHQVQSVKDAAEVIEVALQSAWGAIRVALQSGAVITDCDVQKLILKVFEEHDCLTDSPPHCAINEDSADPHFSPDSSKPVPIRFGDFILIDLWCKKKVFGAVYADVTRVGVAATEPSKKIQEVFSIVRQAQKTATEFICRRFAENKEVKGFEVDEVCRKVIADAGYGKFFTHRTGHNICTDLHGPGTHLDSLETYDDRPLLKGTCCSCEPGIYLPREFGVRLENDVYIDKNGEVHIFGGEQEEVKTLVE
ncbi:MAG: aminopeptidase P family protein [Simkania sp.]|nr:aminopeptidase P family protein [Simkania sp.]